MPGVLGGMMESVPTSPTLTKVSTKLDPMTCFFALVLMPSCVHDALASCHAQVKEQYFFNTLTLGIQSAKVLCTWASLHQFLINVCQ